MNALYFILVTCSLWITCGAQLPLDGPPPPPDDSPVGALVGGIVPPLASLAFLGDPNYVAGVLSDRLKDLFNGKFKTKPYPEKQSKPIKCPKDLDCDFRRNGTKCRWRNVKGDGGRQIHDVFVETSANPAKGNQNWTMIMGNSERPRKPYAVTGSAKAILPLGIWFVSDPIPKQPKDGKIKLRYWLSPPTTMRACVRGMTRPNFLSCSKKLETSSSADGEMKIAGPINEEFEIVLDIGNFKSPKGSLAVFDDIEYESDLCN